MCFSVIGKVFVSGPLKLALSPNEDNLIIYGTYGPLYMYKAESNFFFYTYGVPEKSGPSTNMLS